MSGQEKKETERVVLTSWRRQMERLVRMRKESDRVMGTHFLKNGIRACQDKETKRAGVLTLWRWQSVKLCLTRKDAY